MDNRKKNKKILVSGASIAGPSVAYWLSEFGYDVTIVEKSDGFRKGGYLIDIRGTAVGAVSKMGILPQLKAKHVTHNPFIFFNPKGRRIGKIMPDTLFGSDRGHDVEVSRGDLAELLFDLTKDRVEYRFSDHMTAMSEDADGIDVTFNSGRQERYDLHIGADGLHSGTRKMVFGPEENFSHYLGYTFALFEMPNVVGASREGWVFNQPGRSVMLGVREGMEEGKMGVMMIFKCPQFSREELTSEGTIELIRKAFADAGWVTPNILANLDKVEDMYSDSMTQIHLPRWSSGRVALTGDAAHGPTFFSGQGTSTSLVGSYVLAGELGTRDDHGSAFAAYERVCRGFIEQNQKVAYEGADTLAPDSSFKIGIRNTIIRLAPLLSRLGLISQTASAAYTAMTLPDYASEAQGNEA